MSPRPKRQQAPDGMMTIGELARRTGMTVRNIRAHQTRGLLPPPEVHGRTGYYNEDHLTRVELTREMQAEGLNLEAIRRVLESSQDSSTEIIDFARAVRAPFEEETPEIFEREELAGIWGAKELDPKLLRRGEKLGILRELPDGKIEAISPRLQRAGGALVELGVSPEAVLDIAAKLRRQADATARAFVDLFVKEVWRPFAEAGRPEEDWPKMREALERMRPLASDAVLAMFQLAMSEETEKASERTLRSTRGTAKPKRGRKRRSR